jgi:hypothetical protein
LSPISTLPRVKTTVVGLGFKVPLTGDAAVEVAVAAGNPLDPHADAQRIQEQRPTISRMRSVTSFRA